MEEWFTTLEISHCSLLLDKKQLESDNHTISSNFACTTANLHASEERGKKEEIEVDQLSRCIWTLEAAESSSLETIASFISELEKVCMEMKTLRPCLDTTIPSDLGVDGFFQSYLSQDLV